MYLTSLEEESFTISPTYSTGKEEESFLQFLEHLYYPCYINNKVPNCFFFQIRAHPETTNRHNAGKPHCIENKAAKLLTPCVSLRDGESFSGKCIWEKWECSEKYRDISWTSM